MRPPRSSAAELNELLRRWTRTSEDVAAGYRLGLDDYLNDMDARQRIESILCKLPQAKRGKLEARLHALDARIREHLKPIGRCLWGPNAARENGWNATDNWWYFAVPAEPGTALAAELKSRRA
jgi:hypothetical protein